jgi:integrase
MAGKAGHRSFGYMRRLPSKRWQATYELDGTTYKAPTTFQRQDDAVAWLNAERKLIDSGEWVSPADRVARRNAQGVTLTDYAADWLAHRTLKPRTMAHYRRLIDVAIKPRFGSTPVAKIAPADVRSWWASLDPATPTQNAHAYALLKAICKTAVDDDLLAANPCRVRGAGNARRASKTEPATLGELEAIVAAAPERYRAMILLASWCAMRFGELIELRRSDVDLKRGVVKVQRAAVWLDGQAVIGSPKSDAGVRVVAVPPHVLPTIREHLASMPMTGRDALLFPSAGDPAKHMRPATLCKIYYPAREAAGRPDLRFHDLRHTGAVMATRTGASLAEVMARLGHSTPAAAMRYQHAARGRDAEIAAALSDLANGSRG